VTVANPNTKSLQRAFPLQNLQRSLSASRHIVATTLLWVCPLPYRSASAFWIVRFKFIALGCFAKGMLFSSPLRAFFRLLVILRYIPYFVICQMSQHSMPVVPTFLDAFLPLLILELFIPPFCTIVFSIPTYHTSLQEYFIYQYILSLTCLLPVMG